MRIKADVEFVKKECEAHDCGWLEEMESYCGRTVVSNRDNDDGSLGCDFSDGEYWLFPKSCLEEDVMFEKGQKYFVNFSTVEYTFVEESDHFAIFTCGASTLAFSKSECTFQKVKEPPRFLNEEWKIKKTGNCIAVMCGGYYIASLNESGCHMIGGVSKRLGLPLDENGAVVVVKK